MKKVIYVTMNGRKVRVNAEIRESLPEVEKEAHHKVYDVVENVYQVPVDPENASNSEYAVYAVKTRYWEDYKPTDMTETEYIAIEKEY
ncbi:MAG: hypothetical protein ACOC2U_04090 [bacterium]